jgi:hypothetical protein
LTKLAALIAIKEGFYIIGSQPNRKDNPGDLRHSPHSSHVGENINAIGIISSDALGWQDLERQLQLYANRGLTLQQAIAIYAPKSENNTSQYLNFVAVGLGHIPITTPMTDVLKILV